MADDIIHRYKVIAIIGVCLCIFFALASLWVPIYLDYYDKNVYLQDYLSGKSGNYPIIIGDMDIESYKLLHQVNNLSKEKEVIMIGGSQTRIGLLPNYSLDNGYTLNNLGLSRATSYSDKIMLNYIKLEGNRELNNNDVVVFDIFFETFRDLKDDYTKSQLDRFGVYTIDDSGNIYGSLGELQRCYLEYVIPYNTFMNIISGFFDKQKSYLLNGISAIISPKDNISDYERYYIISDQRTKGTKYPSDSTETFKELLIETRNISNVVVVNLYVPSWMRDNPREQEYEMWLNESLLPFLSENNICYLDFSRTIPDNEYSDFAHLNRQGRENYTRQFDMAFKNLSIFKEI